MRSCTLYWIVGVIVLINLLLLSIFLSQKKEEVTHPDQKLNPTNNPINLSFQNNTNTQFALNIDDTKSLLEKVGVIRNNQLYNFKTSDYYSPDELSIQIQPLNSSNSTTFVDRIEIDNRIVFAYVFETSLENTKIIASLDESYFNAIPLEQRIEELNSLIRKAFITLGAMSEKKEILTTQDRKNIIDKNNELVNFIIIYAKN